MGRGREFLTAHPLRGAGLASYTQRIVPYHSQVAGENIEIFHHQHNIFLTMWVNLGWPHRAHWVCVDARLVLSGGLSYIMYHVTCNKTYYKKKLLQATPRHELGPNAGYRRYEKHRIFSPPCQRSLRPASLTRYIKNDLALFFWLLFALMLVHTHKPEQS